MTPRTMQSFMHSDMNLQDPGDELRTSKALQIEPIERTGVYDVTSQAI